MRKSNILCSIVLSCALVFSATACTSESLSTGGLSANGSETTTTGSETAAEEPDETTTTTSETNAEETETTTTESESDITSVKDYTSAPYYEKLVDWFDRWGYTEEQRESFLMDTETCDWILYNDDLWATDDLSPVVMLNGDIAANDSVTDIRGDIQNIYTLDLCLAVPYGTAKEERTGDNWTKLEAGSEWNGLTVSEASSNYNTRYKPPKSVIGFQEVYLNGNITVNTSAEYSLDHEGGKTGAILLIPDEASRSILPSLYPDFENRTSEDKWYSEEAIYFTITSDNEYFQQIADKLDAGKDFTVSVTADSFMLQWTDYGLVSDGVTHGRFENILDININ